MAKTNKATMEDLKALAEGGLTSNQIATRLNKAELSTPTGKQWYDSTVIYYARQQYSAPELTKLFPQLAADAEKYDAKQAAKKEKARARDAQQALPKTDVVLPSKRKAADLPEGFGRDAVRGAAQDLAKADVVLPSKRKTDHYREVLAVRGAAQDLAKSVQISKDGPLGRVVGLQESKTSHEGAADGDTGATGPGEVWVVVWAANGTLWVTEHATQPEALSSLLRQPSGAQMVPLSDLSDLVASSGYKRVAKGGQQ